VANTSRDGVYVAGKSGTFRMRMVACLGSAWAISEATPVSSGFAPDCTTLPLRSAGGRFWVVRADGILRS
jgi:hypothetical protein